MQAAGGYIYQIVYNNYTVSEIEIQPKRRIFFNFIF